MPDDPTAVAASGDSRLPWGEGPAAQAGAGRRRPNPYVEVALTYIRRPFASRPRGLMAASFACGLVAMSLADRLEVLRDSGFIQLLLLCSVFISLTMHIQRQFVDSRAHLVPRFRRVHATVAAGAAFIAAAVIPTLLSWLAGSYCIGLVAVAVLLFGAILWAAARRAAWPYGAIVLGCMAFCCTDWGTAYLRAILNGQLEPYAAAILVLGILITVVAGIQLVRLREETWNDDSALQWEWDWDWNQRTRQGWGDEGRGSSRVRNWIRERQMARLTRLARHAQQSWWARVCRWQVGMVSGSAFWLWILAVVAIVPVVSWWMRSGASRPAAVMVGTTTLILIFLPAMLTLVGVLQWRQFQLRHESLLPVRRTSYIRQVFAAAALSQFQLWAGMSVVLVLWWLLIGPRPFHYALLGGALAFSAAFQVAIFGVAVWSARYRSPSPSPSPGPAVLLSVLLAFVFGALVALRMAWTRYWTVEQPGPLPPEVLWIAGILAVFGLLITGDAYRRWLTAEFD